MNAHGLIRRIRAEVQHLRAGRVGGLEVAAPRLNDRELGRVRKTQAGRAIPAGGDADDGAAAATRDRAVMRVDPARQLNSQRRRPIGAGPPVEILGIVILAERPLWHDQDGRHAVRGECMPNPADAQIRGRPGRKPMQEVHNRVPALTARVADRQLDQILNLAVERDRVKRLRRRLHPNRRCPPPHSSEGDCGREHQSGRNKTANGGHNRPTEAQMGAS